MTGQPALDLPDAAGAREQALRRSMSFFLLSDRYSHRIVVEVDRVEGTQPSPTALSALRAEIERWTGCEQVSIELDDVIGLADWEPIAGLAPENRGPALAPWIGTVPGAWRNGDERLYLLYVPEELAPLGWQVELSVPVEGAASSRVPAIFVHEGTVRREAQLWIGRNKIESYILVHELGHALGLVADPDHRADSDYGAHCTVAGCVMAAPGSRSRVRDSANAMIGRLPSEFCRYCQADLRDARRWFEQADDAEVERRSRARAAYRAR